MASARQYDEVWIANYKRCRKTLKGTRMALDAVTGYMRPVGRDGFTAEDRATFVERFKICNNIAQICRSLHINVMSFYDAVAVDDKFRKDINAANLLLDRSKQLNNGLEAIKHEDKTTTINDLARSAEKYL